MGLVGIGTFGAPEMLIILVIVMLLFGASRLKDIGGGLGQSIVEFKKATRGAKEEEGTQQEDERSREGSAVATASVNGAGERDDRPVGAAAPAQSASIRPPDFTGR